MNSIIETYCRGDVKFSYRHLVTASVPLPPPSPPHTTNSTIYVRLGLSRYNARSVTNHFTRGSVVRLIGFQGRNTEETAHCLPLFTVLLLVLDVEHDSSHNDGSVQGVVVWSSLSSTSSMTPSSSRSLYMRTYQQLTATRDTLFNAECLGYVGSIAGALDSLSNIKHNHPIIPTLLGYHPDSSCLLYTSPSPRDA